MIDQEQVEFNQQKLLGKAGKNYCNHLGDFLWDTTSHFVAGVNGDVDDEGLATILWWNVMG